MFEKIRARIEFLRFQRVHRGSRASIERWQTRRLQRMVEHVSKNVPMYGERFASVDVAVRRAPTLDTLRQFPIVLRRDYMGKPIEEYTDNSARVDGTWIKTSGTSGEPFTVLERLDLQLPHYGESVVYRAFVSAQPARLLKKMRVARIMFKSPPRDNRLFLYVPDVREHTKESVARIREYKPEILESYASILYDVARQVERDGVPLEVPYVISGGERLSDALRAYLTRVFKAEVFNRYGMEEFAVVASECEQHNGMHTICESLIVEIVDDAGQPVPEGHHGRIIVTDLYNTAMPYIRYDTGDHGTMTWERCACGLSSPRLWLEGRYTAWLSFGGTRINHLEYDLALDSFMNVILQYLVIKKSDTEAVVQIVPGIGYDSAMETKIRSNMTNLLGPSVQVRIECVDEIPRMPRGKSKIVLDESR